MTTLWPWVVLAGLGVYHGVNPGMGWLFAVGRGLQERSRSAVVKALLPIAAGHEASIVLVVLSVALSQRFVPPHTVRLAAALALIAAGLYTLARPRAHPRGFGMRIGFASLAAWSFLMSSAHGAGLMLAPVLLGLPIGEQYTDPRQVGLTAALAALVHVTAMLLTMGVVAIVVYEKLGLRFLRRGWFNLDLAWSGVLLLSGSVTLFTA
ncbi:MAG: hypothetical protein M3024_06815 [Candidatus Dormibacteraeota bacterium]|nr:hypothetical protein [Candidatus Dormibacteraeota bacterium]